MNTKAKTIAVGKAVIHALQLGSQVAEERARQVEKWGVQRVDWVSSKYDGGYYTRMAAHFKKRCQEAGEQGSDSWDLILLEEAYEALEELQVSNLPAARVELVQVMAVCASIIEHIDEVQA